MDGLTVSTGKLRRSITKHSCDGRPYLKPAIGENIKRRAKTEFVEALRSVVSDIMRRTADIDSELLRTAEIRAMENPS